MEYRHELVCGAVVEKVTCEGEVTSLNLVGRVVRKNCRNLRLRRRGWVVTRGLPPHPTLTGGLPPRPTLTKGDPPRPTRTEGPLRPVDVGLLEIGRLLE